MSPTAALAKLLRTEREARGLTLEEAQSKTHLDIDTIEAGYVRPGEFALNTLLSIYECNGRTRADAHRLRIEKVM